MRLEIHVDITIIIKKPVLVDLGVSLALLAIDVATNSRGQINELLPTAK